jgi:hypothetical protein
VFLIRCPANAKPYIAIPLRTPSGYSANDASVGDMDGDGVYEVVIHLTGRAKDNSQAGITDPPGLSMLQNERNIFVGDQSWKKYS